MDVDRLPGRERPVAVTEQDRDRVVIDVADADVHVAVVVEVRRLVRARPVADGERGLEERIEQARPVRLVQEDAKIGRILVNDRDVEEAVAVDVGGESAVGAGADATRATMSTPTKGMVIFTV